VNVRLLCITGI